MKAYSKKKGQLLLDISLIFFTFISTSIFAKNNFPESKVFDCKVLDELENIDGVSSVFLGPGFITITKSENIDWDAINQDIVDIFDKL